MIKGYREKIEGVNPPRIPEDRLEVLDKHLIRSAASGEPKVFYHKMYVHCLYDLHSDANVGSRMGDYRHASQPIPVIRLTEPTPGTSPAPSMPPRVPQSSPLLPVSDTPDTDVSHTHLEPKKSKLGLLSVGTKDKDKGRGKQQQQHTRSGSSGRSGFDIFVDLTYDPDIGEIEKKTQKPRISTSSFKAGALSAASPMSRTKAVEKKQSTLGLGLRR